MKPLPIIALAISLTAFTSAPAQQPAAISLGTEAVNRAYARPIAEVKYDSLPLEEIVGRLRKDFPEINFILPDELNQVIVRLEMRNVTLVEILEAVQIAGRSEYLMFEQVNERLITFRRDETAVQRETPKPALRAFNLSGYLAGRDPDATKRAMEELNQVMEDSWLLLSVNDPSLRHTPPPSLRLHAGTQMLIGVGNPEQLRVLEEIVYNLPGMSPRPVAGLHSSGGGMGAGMMGGGPGLPDERFLRRYGSGGGGGAPGTTNPLTR